jgi:taurine transport system substrate-binding protein
MVALVKAVAKADAEYRANVAKWTADSPQAKAIAKWTKAEPATVPAVLASFGFPDLTAQASDTWLGGGAAKTLADTATFLKEQGRVQEVKPSYAPFVTNAYVLKAMGK